MALKAVIGTSDANSLKAKIKTGSNARAETIALATPKTLNDLTNIDFSALEQGAVLIYDETSGLWKAKADMDDGTRIEGGHY